MNEYVWCSGLPATACQFRIKEFPARISSVWNTTDWKLSGYSSLRGEFITKSKICEFPIAPPIATKWREIHQFIVCEPRNARIKSKSIENVQNKFKICLRVSRSRPITQFEIRIVNGERENLSLTELCVVDCLRQLLSIKAFSVNVLVQPILHSNYIFCGYFRNEKKIELNAVKQWSWQLRSKGSHKSRQMERLYRYLYTLWS